MMQIFQICKVKIILNHSKIINREFHMYLIKISHKNKEEIYLALKIIIL